MIDDIKEHDRNYYRAHKDEILKKRRMRKAMKKIERLQVTGGGSDD